VADLSAVDASFAGGLPTGWSLWPPSTAPDFSDGVRAALQTTTDDHTWYVQADDVFDFTVGSSVTFRIAMSNPGPAFVGLHIDGDESFFLGIGETDTGYRFIQTTGEPDPVAHADYAAAGNPEYFRILRNTTTEWVGYSSTDGSTWVERGRQTMTGTDFTQTAFEFQFMAQWPDVPTAGTETGYLYSITSGAGSGGGGGGGGTGSTRHPHPLGPNDYDPHLLTIERKTGVDTWAPVEVASLNYSANYDPDDGGTLIVGSETVRFTISGWGSAGLLNPLDVIRVRYDGIDIGCGLYTVDTAQTTTTVDPEAKRHSGQTERVDCQCSAVGTYAAALDTIVTWPDKLPAETAIKRVRRWVTVDNWTE